MRPVLLLALLGSLLIHVLLLLGIRHELLVDGEADVVLSAVLRPPLPERLAEVLSPAAPAVSAAKQAPSIHRDAPDVLAAPLPLRAAAEDEAVALPSAQLGSYPEEVAPVAEVLHQADPAAVVGKAVLPGSGYINFVVERDSPRMQIGRAVHRWEFHADGSYRLVSEVETSGLVALLKPLRQRYESIGQLTGRGLQPTLFRVQRNGRSTGEDVEFDWAEMQLTLLRDGSVHRLHAGAQDMLSFNYQLAYLSSLESGTGFAVATGRKYARQTLDAHGEEWLEIPAGRFRTLHLRASGATLTEIWIALDHGSLPVKIRFTDRKGESYTQIATDIDPLPRVAD